MDLIKKGLSPREFDAVASCVGLLNMIDTESKKYAESAVRFMSDKNMIRAQLLENPQLLREVGRLAAHRLRSLLTDGMILTVSGGSSVGVKDAACRIIASVGTLLLHGIAIKPGKPTILGKTGGKPIVGLPGHPVAAYFITKLFVQPLLGRLTGRNMTAYTVTAKVTESISANHGRAQYHCCRLERRDGQLLAQPIRGKSGLITTLAGADGYFCIGRDCEGLPKGAEIQVTITEGV